MWEDLKSDQLKFKLKTTTFGLTETLHTTECTANIVHYDPELVC